MSWPAPPDEPPAAGPATDEPTAIEQRTLEPGAIGPTASEPTAIEAPTLAAAAIGSAGPHGGPHPQAPPRRPIPLATTSLVVALIGVGTAIAAPIGALLGHRARTRIRRTGEGGEGFAVAAIIVGWTITGLALVAAGLTGVLLIAHAAVA